MNFDDAFRRVLGTEGDYSNDPLDLGGETRWGISKRAYPMLDIASLTVDDAKRIYKRDYWGPAGCDAVPELLRYPLFDAAVNQGVEGAIKMLQRAVRETEDGVLGSRTLQAVSSTDPALVAYRFAAARLAAYAGAPEKQWLRFGRGWLRRVAAVMSV